MLKQANEKRILIVGGGPVGLFAATRLVDFGIPVILIDKSSQVSTDIRASTILKINTLCVGGGRRFRIVHKNRARTWEGGGSTNLNIYEARGQLKILL